MNRSKRGQVSLWELTKTSGKDDSNDSTKFHGETSGRGVQSQAVTKVAHDVVTIGPDTESNSSTTEAAVELVS